MDTAAQGTKYLQVTIYINVCWMPAKCQILCYPFVTGGRNTLSGRHILALCGTAQKHQMRMLPGAVIQCTRNDIS